MNNGIRYKDVKIENNSYDNIFFEKLINLNFDNKQYSNNYNINISKIKSLKQKNKKTDEAYIKEKFLYKNKIHSFIDEIVPEKYKSTKFLVRKFLKNKDINKKYCSKIAESNNPQKNKIYITKLKFSKKNENKKTSKRLSIAKISKNNEIDFELNDSKKNFEVDLNLDNNYIFKNNFEEYNQMSSIKKINLKDNNDIKLNKIQKNEISENKNIVKNIHDKEIYSHNIIKNFHKSINKYNGFLIIIYFIMDILFCNFDIVYSIINLCSNQIYNNIMLNSYEIKLKVKGTGLKNILSASSPYIYQCPSNIYINEILFQDYTDCHYIDIKESDSVIKLKWNNNNNIIESTKGMFNNCEDITEIDMRQFDTSLVTDMSYMFSLCISLSSLNVENLNTEKVETFENMFYNCKSLTSLNLESFSNPSATSLYRMFYGCENLEYINIKNFDEKKNMTIDDMFYNIPPNSVICLLSCIPPSNFTINTMNKTKTIISWESNERNKYIISYGSQNLVNPEEGTKINVNGKSSYTFTELNYNQKYKIYIKTDCDIKSSYWLGPLLISFESHNMPYQSSNSINTCSKVIYDSGGPNRNYKNNDNSVLTIYPDEPGKFVSLRGFISAQITCDFIYIYEGAIASEAKLVYKSPIGDIPLIISKTGPLTIKFKSNSNVNSKGFELFVSCITQQKSIYKLIKDNNCRMISYDNNWRNIQNLIVFNTMTCDNNAELNLSLNDNYYCYPKPDNIAFDSDKNYKCLYYNECPVNYKYIIEEKNQCVYNCKQYPGFPFEFQKKCYYSCPKNISEISEEKENYCEIICPKESPFEIIEIQHCVSNCTISQLNNKLCKLNFKSNNKTEMNEILEKMVENIRDKLINSLDLDTSIIDEGEDIIIQEKEISVTITNNNNQKKQINSKTNATNIGFEKCETKLKNQYNISENESLYILKMDIKQEGYKISKMQYEVYYPLNGDSKLHLLNLSIF